MLLTHKPVKELQGLAVVEDKKNNKTKNPKGTNAEIHCGDQKCEEVETSLAELKTNAFYSDKVGKEEVNGI